MKLGRVGWEIIEECNDFVGNVAITKMHCQHDEQVPSSSYENEICSELKSQTQISQSEAIYTP